MGIGFKQPTSIEDKIEPALRENENTSMGDIPDSVSNSSQMQQVMQDSVNTDGNEVNSLNGVNTIDKANNDSKKTMIIIIAVVAILAVGFFIVSGINDKKKAEKPATIIDNSSSEESEEAQDSNEQGGEQTNGFSFDDKKPANESTENNPNAVYDANGNLISNNGIYDQEGNIISNNSSVIDPGNQYTTTEQDATSSTSAVVYSASDYIKDLNGLDVPAIYNVKSISYVHDYANYERKRAIIDRGMEMYWMDLNYKGLKYRAQITYKEYLQLGEDVGIVELNMEVLNLEGGEKIISFAEKAATEEE